MNYLFWAYLVIWLLLFSYLIYQDNRQRNIDQQLRQLESIVKKDITA